MMPDDGNSLLKSSYTGSFLVQVGNATLLPILNVGHIAITIPQQPLHLSCVLNVPQLSSNLLSVRHLYYDNDGKLLVLALSTHLPSCLVSCSFRPYCFHKFRRSVASSFRALQSWVFDALRKKIISLLFLQFHQVA